MLKLSEFQSTSSRQYYARVIRGHLQGLEGEIMANSDGTHTLTISLSLLGGATVLINPQDVEKI